MKLARVRAEWAAKKKKAKKTNQTNTGAASPERKKSKAEKLAAVKAQWSTTPMDCDDDEEEVGDSDTAEEETSTDENTSSLGKVIVLVGLAAIVFTICLVSVQDIWIDMAEPTCFHLRLLARSFVGDTLALTIWINKWLEQRAAQFLSYVKAPSLLV